MRLRAMKEMFVGGSLRRKGDVFDSKRRWKHTEIVDENGNSIADKKEDDKSPVDGKGPGAAELRALCAAAGIAYKVTDSKEVLQALLDEERKKSAPAASGAPDKSEASK